MREFLAVGFGGFLGSCLRFAFGKLPARLPLAVPFGTLLSNALAGLCIGFIIGLERQTTALPPRTKLFLTTGLLGGLSTFSTFSLETVTLFQSGKALSGIVNAGLNLGFSFIGVLAGMGLAAVLWRKA